MLGPLYPSQVMLVIDAAVTNVEDLSSLEEYLAGLGKKHRAVGVRLGSFSVGSRVLSCSRAAGAALSQPPPTTKIHWPPPHCHFLKWPEIEACFSDLPAQLTRPLRASEFSFIRLL